MEESSDNLVKPFHVSRRKQSGRLSINNNTITTYNIAQIIILVGITVSSLYILFNAYGSPTRC